MNEPVYIPVAVGDIFEMSWGYDQTNVDYFQVVRVTPKGAYVREIAAKQVPGSEGFMSCRVTPDKSNFLSENSSWCGMANTPLFRKVNLDGRGGANFSIKGRYWAHRIASGRSTYCSWYA